MKTISSSYGQEGETNEKNGKIVLRSNMFIWEVLEIGAY